MPAKTKAASMRRSARGVASLLLAGCAAVSCSVSFQLNSFRNFVAPAALPLSQGSVRSASLVGNDCQSRSEAEPLTRMYADPRERTRPQGGGRKGFKTARQPALGYAKASIVGVDGRLEPAATVIKRAYDMMDQETEVRTIREQSFFRNERAKKKFFQESGCRKGRNLNERKDEDRMKDEWLRWVRGPGRELGLTTPVIFKGPKLGDLMTKEMDAETEPLPGMSLSETILKKLDDKVRDSGKKNLKEVILEENGIDPKEASMWRPKELEDGQWYAEDDPYNPHNLWGTRSLQKWPYLIGKRGTPKKVHGNTISGNTNLADE